MPTLLIHRDSGYADSLRSYAILLDGREVGRIGAGESKSFPIAPGTHTIQVRIDWCATPVERFAAAETDEVGYQVFSKLRGLHLLGALFAMFDPGGWIGLCRLDPPPGIVPERKG